MITCLRETAYEAWRRKNKATLLMCFDASSSGAQSRVVLEPGRNGFPDKSPGNFPYLLLFECCVVEKQAEDEVCNPWA